jgi:translation initiation factor 2 beta subunit (eIF-2beta)/eIF-5
MLSIARERTASRRRARIQSAYGVANLETIIKALRTAKYAARRGLGKIPRELYSDYSEMLLKIREAKHLAQFLCNEIEYRD